MLHGAFFICPFRNFLLCFRMKLISILIASGLLLQINLVSRYAHTTITIENNMDFSGNPDAKRLYDDLLSNYNKLVRPVSNVTEVCLFVF